MGRSVFIYCTKSNPDLLTIRLRYKKVDNVRKEAKNRAKIKKTSDSKKQDGSLIVFDMIRYVIKSTWKNRSSVLCRRSEMFSASLESQQNEFSATVLPRFGPL